MQVDNTSDVSAINKMGSVKSIEMNNEVHLIWESIGTQNNWLTATHYLMRMLIENPGNRSLEQSECRTGRTFIMLRKNLMPLHQLTCLHQDLKFYAFPLFICLSRVIRKIRHDRAEEILAVPDWPNLFWYNQFCNMI